MTLKGMRVLEMANDPATAYGGMVLSALGAEVLKIEPPGTGDESRRIEPIILPGISALFAAYNLGKKSLTLDLRKPRARQAFFRLVPTADVVLENISDGRANSLHAGYDELKRIKSDLIFCSVSGYGRTGAYAHRESNDLTAQAQFGMMATTGEDRNSEPIRTAYPVTDVGAGINAAFAIIVALWHRQRTGKGQRVETTRMHTQMAFAGHVATQQDFARTDPTHARALCLQLAPYQAYRARDGWVVVATSNEAQWSRICTWPAFARLADDPRFGSMQKRVRHRRDLAAAFEKIFRTMSTHEIETLFEKVDVPCTRVNSLSDAMANASFGESTLDRIRLPEHGTLSVPRIPFSLSACPFQPRRPPPRLGEHNETILSELGYDAKAIKAIGSPVRAGKPLEDTGTSSS